MSDTMNNQLKKIKVVQQILQNEIKNNPINLCLINDSNCSNKIIKAHSIQNKNILEKISDGSGHVWTFSIDDQKKMEKVGVNRASVFKGFCGKHDNSIFEFIDNDIYSKLKKEEAHFLYAFRALSKELYTKKNIVEKHHQFFQKIDDGDYSYLKKKFPILDENDLNILFGPNSIMRDVIKGNQIAISELRPYCDRFYKALNNNKFNEIKTTIIKVKNIIRFAASTCFAPEYNSKGIIVNDITNLSESLKALFVSVIPDGEDTYILLSYFADEESTLSTFLKDLMQMERQETKEYLERLLLGHCENMVFSKQYISSLSENEKEYLYTFYKDTAFQGDSIDMYRNKLQVKPKLLY